MKKILALVVAMVLGVMHFSIALASDMAIRDRQSIEDIVFVVPARFQNILNGEFATFDEIMEIQSFIMRRIRENNGELTKTYINGIYIPENIRNLFTQSVVTVDDLAEAFNFIMPRNTRAVALDKQLSAPRLIREIFPDQRLAQEISNGITGGNVNATVTQSQLDSILWFGVWEGTPRISNFRRCAIS